MYKLNKIPSRTVIIVVEQRSHGRVIFLNELGKISLLKMAEEALTKVLTTVQATYDSLVKFKDDTKIQVKEYQAFAYKNYDDLYQQVSKATVESNEYAELQKQLHFMEAKRQKHVYRTSLSYRLLQSLAFTSAVYLVFRRRKFRNTSLALALSLGTICPEVSHPFYHKE